MQTFKLEYIIRNKRTYYKMFFFYYNLLFSINFHIIYRVLTMGLPILYLSENNHVIIAQTTTAS